MKGYISHHEHGIMCGSVKSLYCTGETHITLYDNHTGIKIGNKYELINNIIGSK